MKYSVFTLLLVVAGAFAMPEIDNQARESRIVAGQIRNVIAQISRFLVDVGLDPVDIERIDYEYIAVPFLAELRVFAEAVHFSGISNIVAERVDYNVLLNRLRFTIALPELLMSIGNSGVNVNVFGSRYSGEFSGRLSVQGIRLAGEVRVNIGIISGISIRSLSLDLNLGGIQSDLVLKALGEDYSDLVNEILGDTIPSAFQENRDQINRLLESVIRDLLDQILIFY